MVVVEEEVEEVVVDGGAQCGVVRGGGVVVEGHYRGLPWGEGWS